MIDRRNRPQPLSDLIGVVLKPAVERHGLATSEIIARWPEIVGQRFHRVTRPIRVLWPRRGPLSTPEQQHEPGTLVICVESAHVLDVQYAAEALLERVNALYGYKAIGKLQLRQGPVARREETMRPRIAEQAPRPEAIAAVEDVDLRKALEELGKGVAGQRKLTGS
jgi:hypothetical protein